MFSAPTIFLRHSLFSVPTIFLKDTLGTHIDPPKTLFVFGSHPQVIDLPKTLSRCFCYLTHHHLPKTPSVFGTHCNLPFFPVSLPRDTQGLHECKKTQSGISKSLRISFRAKFQGHWWSLQLDIGDDHGQWWSLQLDWGWSWVTTIFGSRHWGWWSLQLDIWDDFCSKLANNLQFTNCKKEF